MRELIQQQKISLKNNHIMIQTNSTLLSGLKKLPGLKEERKKIKFEKKKVLKKLNNNKKNNKLNTLIK